MITTYDTMEHLNDYFSLPDSKPMQRSSSSWSQHDWTQPMTSWETTTPSEMPTWQYTAPNVHHNDSTMYYSHSLPMSPFLDQPTNSSTLSSPVNMFNNHHARFAPVTPLYNIPGQSPRTAKSATPRTTRLQVPECVEECDDLMEDEDSEGYGWDPASRSPHTPPSASSANRQRPPHRRTQSANEMNLKNAKRAHTVVERNYRERLNDKIADLALYLFETSSDARTKPSKSLVMTRAKERLKQLESRNQTLEAEVVKLRQHIAILDHIVTSRAGEPSPPQS